MKYKLYRSFGDLDKEVKSMNWLLSSMAARLRT